MHFDWTFNPNLFPGPLPMRLYGLFAGLALIGGFLIYRYKMLKAGVKEEIIAIYLPYLLISSIVGARLVHCFFYEKDFCLNPAWKIFLIWQGGLASHGALIGVVFATWLYTRRYKLSLSLVLDHLSFGAALTVFFVRMGNFSNSEIVGRPTGGEWGVRFIYYAQQIGCSPLYRHPVQLYEAFVGILIFVLLWVVEKKKKRQGNLAALFMTLYFGARILLEPYKARLILSDEHFLSMGQYLSFIPFLFGLSWLVFGFFSRKQIGVKS